MKSVKGGDSEQFIESMYIHEFSKEAQGILHIIL